VTLRLLQVFQTRRLELEQFWILLLLMILLDLMEENQVVKELLS
jgi:hypothetical protein